MDSSTHPNRTDFCYPIFKPAKSSDIRAAARNMTKHAFVLRQIEQDISDGILVRKSPAAQELLGEALRLAKKYAPRLNIRSLDILRIAAARVLRYSSFASFDKRQRDLASASGLRILPAKLITPNP